MENYSERLREYTEVMAALEDPSTPAARIRECFGTIRTSLAETAALGNPEEVQAAKATSLAFEYWAGVFDQAAAAATREGIKALLRTHLCAAHEHSMPLHNISQGAMKAAIHCIWTRLYSIMAGRGHPTPLPAIRDALTPPLQRAQEYMHELYKEIAAEKGETVEQMMKRVCGDL